ncbi:nucleotidyltransferase domain-containing protein [Massilia sp. W12]|uniref:nucleotidyltransferase domain-containing protein n=1 Tax=Massilia sp. W12 TaxID=3126507 RepID=UPI0030D5EE9A
MMTEEQKSAILGRLRQAEIEHDVRILLAVEAGSRAWGFDSPDSDFDVRFIYMHAPSWYQAVDLEEKRDVIEYPLTDGIDLHGWDLRKALRLLWKANPAFIEWLQAPLCYIEAGCFKQTALRSLSGMYVPLKGIYHYRNMAASTFRSHLREAEVRQKKYFYVLRDLLAARWIAQHGAPPPVDFARLLPLLQDAPAALAEVEDLLARKRAGVLDSGPARPALQAFIEQELAQDVGARPEKSRAPDVIGELNRIFHLLLQEQKDCAG